MTDIKAFLSGYKPAFLYNRGHKKPWFYEDQEVKALGQYMHINVVNVEKAKNLTLYFQGQSEYDHFLQQTKSTKIGSFTWYKELGLILGYPPRAVDHYVSRMQDPTIQKHEVGVHFYGIGCKGHVQDIEANVRWLWDTYPAFWFTDKKVMIAYQSECHEIDYKDYDMLTKTEDLIIKKANAI